MSWKARPAAVAGALLLVAALASIAARPDSLRDALPPHSPRFAPPESGVLFADDFSADTLAGWRVNRSGVWSIRRGMLRGDLPDVKQERSLIRAGSTAWTDYAVDLDVCQMRGVDKGVVVRLDGTDGIGVDLRGPGYQDVLLMQGYRRLGRASCINANAAWHHLRIEARGNTYTVYVDGQRLLEARDRHETSPDGGIALPAYTGGAGECTVYYDNVIVTSLTPAPAAGEERKP